MENTSTLSAGHVADASDTYAFGTDAALVAELEAFVPDFDDVDDFRGPVTAEAEIDDAFTRVEEAAARVTIDAAEQYAAIDDALASAGRMPEVFVGPFHATQSDAVEFARRAAVCDLALRLGVSESALHTMAANARTLRTKLPAVWAGFRDGLISEAKVRIIVETAANLPDDSTVLAEFDQTMRQAATRLIPTRLRTKARATREKLHPRPAIARHETAAADRRIWLEAADDGMCWFGAYLPAEAGHRAEARIDATARHLAGRPKEKRTLPQLRADVLADLLTGDGTPDAVKAHVNVTVPMLTLLSQDTADDYRANPATLNGYGPIDPETARRLCANAPSLFRLLTDPVDGAILTIDRKSYRPPADLKRLIRALQPTCSFPGCNRPADQSDLDHTLDWLFDGKTEWRNLAPMCRHHHRVKHNTLWTVAQDQTSGTITWTSPTGTTHDTDPPPF